MNCNFAAKIRPALRILLYNDTYKHIGGAETYCLELLPELKALGHEVKWLAHGEDKPHSEDHIVIPDFNQGKFNYFKSKYFFNKDAYITIKGVLEDFQPDVVHLHHDRYYTFSMLKALKETGIPVVKTIHDYTMLCPSQYYPDLYYDTPGTKSRRENCALICSQGTCLPLKTRLGHPFAHDRKRRIVCNSVLDFIAPSVKLKEHLEKAGFQGVKHLPFFVDEKKWSFNPEREKKYSVLFVGRVETNKGVHILLDAVVELRKKIPGIELNIVGTGSQLEPLRKKVIAQGYEDFVRLPGFVSYENIGVYYNSSNVLVVPSLDMEQFGLIGIEGLANGIAVIGSDTGGIPEWCMHEETGLLFDPEKPEALLPTLERMLLEKGLAKRLTQQGMEMVRDVYDKTKHLEGLLSIYRQSSPAR